MFKYGAGRGADSRFVLILNVLLKMLDAESYQNAGNAVLEYAISTRDFGEWIASNKFKVIAAEHIWRIS